jgi:hypothetical protein
MNRKADPKSTSHGKHGKHGKHDLRQGRPSPSTARLRRAFERGVGAALVPELVRGAVRAFRVFGGSILTTGATRPAIRLAPPALSVAEWAGKFENFNPTGA